MRTTVFYVIIALFIFNISCTYTTSDTELFIYPSVSDLSSIQGLQESPDFDITINKQNAFVYKGFETHDEYEWYGNAGTMVNSPSYHGISFCNFSFKGDIEIKITTKHKLLNWDIKPTLSDVQKVNDSTIIINISKAQKFILKADFDSDHPDYFLVSAEAPEINIPNKEDSSVLFLETGIHKYGQAWDPFVDGIKTVYLAPGAIVEATIKSKNKEGIQILGRGIFAQAFVTHSEEQKIRREQEWDADWMGIHIGRSSDIVVDGITLLNSPGYQLELAKCQNVAINNVKLCGFGEHNNDGLHTYGKDINVNDCFIGCNDDRICVTGLFDDSEGNGDMNWDGTNELSGTPVENVTISNVIFLGLHNNGGDIMFTWNGEDYCKNITIEKCVSINPTNKGFLSALHGGSAIFSDILVQDCHLYHKDLFSLLVVDTNYQGAGGGAFKGMHLKNITLDVPISEIDSIIGGFTATSNVEGIILENIKATDGLITDISETSIELNEFVGTIEYKE